MYAYTKCITHIVKRVTQRLLLVNSIDDLMVSVLASSVLDHGFEPRSSQTKDYTYTNSNVFLLFICCSCYGALYVRFVLFCFAINVNSLKSWLRNIFKTISSPIHQGKIRFRHSISYCITKTFGEKDSGTNNLSAEISIHPKHWLLTGDTTGTNSPPVIGMEHKMLIQNEEFKLLSMGHYIYSYLLLK
jgi:hypothetical protein